VQRQVAFFHFRVFLRGKFRAFLFEHSSDSRLLSRDALANRADHEQNSR
jgi:hypothetical protein